MKKILFVCTGNSCRSPMAAALLRARMPDHWDEHLEISSAGTSAWDGQPATENAVAVLSEKGIDLSGHRSALLTRDQIVDSDLVVVMALEHAQFIRSIVPEAEDKILMLGELDNGRENPDIEDPIGGLRDLYAASRDELDALIQLLINYLADKYKLDG